MHIQEGTITSLTTCTKMTEEVDRRHGVNGNSSGKSNEDAPVQNTAQSASGGRLKFFKDGKFILELVRGCAREGERAGWVSVPRKTFWPPPAAPPPAASSTGLAHLPRNERAASLSVSDDNSSIQSSPWQRDHCWKQSTPRRNISKELTMYYCRASTLLNSTIDPASRLKRRRPFDAAPLDAVVNGAKKPLTNGVCDPKRNGEVDHSHSSKTEDCVDGTPPNDDGAKHKPKLEDDWRSDYDKEKYYHMKLKKPYQYHKLRVYKKIRPSMKRKELSKIVEALRSRVAALPAPVNAKLAVCRHEHAMVSPRKRILRELERVSLEESAGSKRRAKTVPALSTASYPPPAPAASPAPSPGPSHARHNGAAPAPRRDPPVSKNVSSYSIHSLLSMPDDAAPRRSPDAKRSPHSYVASLKTESPSSVASPDLSPSPDHYRYRYGALALGSPGPARDSPTPPFRASYAQPAAQYARPPCYAPYAYGSSAAYAPGPLYVPPALYRAPPPLWMHYALSPPGPWAPLAHPLLTDHIPKEEPSSDLPLNLSKH